MITNAEEIHKKISIILMSNSGFENDDDIQLFELPGNFNYDKYNITENNNSNMSEYIKNEVLPKLESLSGESLLKELD